MTGSLFLNGLNLMMTEPAEEGYELNALANGFEVGSPEAVIANIASQLMDGDPVHVDSFGNRTVTIPMRARVPRPEGIEVGAALDAASAAIERACTWIGFALATLTPPGEGAAERDYSAWTAISTWEFSDVDEMQNERRYYTIAVTARPFARSSVPVVFDLAPAAGGTPPAHLVIADGSTTTGCTFYYGVANPAAGSISSPSGPTASGGVITGGATFSGGNQPAYWVGLSFAASVAATYGNGTLTVASTFAVTGTVPAGRTFARRIIIDGVVVSTSSMTAAGSFTDTVPIPAGGIASTVAVEIQTGGPLTGVHVTVGVDSIAADPIPAPSGALQSRSILIEGTQRTDLSLKVRGRNSGDTANAALGPQVLIHTAPDTDTPFASARAVTSKAGTPDSNCTSGARNALPTTFTLHNTDLAPDTYAVYARVRSTSTGSKSIALTTATQSTITTFTTDASVTYPNLVTNAWTIICLGVFDLPPLESNTGDFDLALTLPAGSGVEIDDLYLCAVGADGKRGQVTLLDTSASYSGLGCSLVELDPADAVNPVQSIWVGSADLTVRQQCPPTTVQALDQHIGTAGTLRVSTVTPACTSSRVSGSYYPTRLL